MLNLSEDDMIFNDDILVVFLPDPDIVALNAQLERLNIDVNTQALQIRIERVKRHKLQINLKGRKGNSYQKLN